MGIIEDEFTDQVYDDIFGFIEDETGFSPQFQIIVASLAQNLTSGNGNQTSAFGKVETKPNAYGRIVL